MKRIQTILVTSFLSLVDIATTSSLFCHGNKFEFYFKHDFYKYTYQSSGFDLFIFGFLRFCFASGLTIAVLRNPSDAIYRIKKLKTVIFIACMATCMYTVLKLLLRSESPGSLKDVWFWLIFSWTHISCIWLFIHCLFLSKIEFIENKHSFSVNKENGDVDERKPLIDSKTSDKSEDDVVKSKKVSIYRLFSYSKPDWVFITLGFIFLTISSTGNLALDI